jgi:hypothetical protein
LRIQLVRGLEDMDLDALKVLGQEQCQEQPRRASANDDDLGSDVLDLVVRPVNDTLVDNQPF